MPFEAVHIPACGLTFSLNPGDLSAPGSWNRSDSLLQQSCLLSPSVPTSRWHQTCSCRCHLLVADGVDTVSCSYLGEASKLSVACVRSVQLCTRSLPLSCFSHVGLPSVCPGCAPMSSLGLCTLSPLLRNLYFHISSDRRQMPALTTLHPLHSASQSLSSSIIIIIDSICHLLSFFHLFITCESISHTPTYKCHENREQRSSRAEQCLY